MLTCKRQMPRRELDTPETDLWKCSESEGGWETQVCRRARRGGLGARVSDCSPILREAQQGHWGGEGVGSEAEVVC